MKCKELIQAKQEAERKIVEIIEQFEKEQGLKVDSVTHSSEPDFDFLVGDSMY